MLVSYSFSITTAFPKYLMTNKHKIKLCSNFDFPYSLDSSCSDSPCQNEGRCREVGNNFMCMCTFGYSGRTCAQRVTACLDDICRNGGTCLNTEKTYKCSCRPGFTGEHCETSKFFMQYSSTNLFSNLL